MKQWTPDIRVNGNSIGGRQGWAYVCNSGEIAVLKADLDASQEYNDYRQYGKVRAIWEYKNRENYKTCRLVNDRCDGGNSWELKSGGCCLSASFTVYDAFDMIDDSQLPIVKRNGIVAVASYSKQSDSASIQLFKLSRVDINCQTVATLIPLTDDEMNDIKKRAEQWCR